MFCYISVTKNDGSRPQSVGFIGLYSVYTVFTTPQEVTAMNPINNTPRKKRGSVSVPFLILMALYGGAHLLAKLLG